MRISSLQIFNIANNSISDANKALVKTQEQLSTGLRVLNPSDDPVAATKILAISEELATTAQYRNNINIAKNDLGVEEATLDAVLNVIQRVQELAVQAGNTATLSTTEYQSIANEVDARLDELKNLLNTKNTNGDYIFGGYKSQSEPFTGSAQSGFQYNGDEGQKNIKIANNTFVAASDSGKAAFVDIQGERPGISTYAAASNRSTPPVTISVGTIVDRDAFDEFYPEDMVISFNEDSNIAPPGKNFTITERSTGRVILADEPYLPGTELIVNGVSVTITGNPASATPTQAGDRLFVDSSDKQDILTTFAQFSLSMKNYSGSSADRDALEETIADTIDNLQNAQTSVLEITSKIGARFSTLESTESLHTDSELALEELLSDLRDVDYAEASTRLASQTLILQAAQTAFVRVSALSLFDQL